MKHVIVISGPTAVGKTKVAIEIATHYKTEIISADSRQFYKEIPIGTATPTKEELALVPHHCIGNLQIIDYYNVYKYEQDVIQLLNNLFQKHDVVVLCGGSGMYIDTIYNGIDDIPDIDVELRNKIIKQHTVEGIESLRITLQKLDPEYYAIVDLKNPARLMRAIEVCIQTGKTFTEVRTNKTKTRDFNCIKIALNLPREELYERINSRVDIMIQDGLEAEAKSMLPYKEHTALKTVGYREFFDYFSGETSYEFAIERIKQNSRNYAKRQISWLHRDKSYHWFSPNEISNIISMIEIKKG
jgi:tRNA dimethylallyltransferase